MDIDGALHTDIYDGLGADLGGYELVAGPVYDPTREYHRAGSDPAQFSSGYKVRHPVSSICEGKLWGDRLESACHHARDRGVRVVWNTGVDRGSGSADILCCVHSRLADAARGPDRPTHADRVAVIPDLLGFKY